MILPTFGQRFDQIRKRSRSRSSFWRGEGLDTSLNIKKRKDIATVIGDLSDGERELNLNIETDSRFGFAL